MNTISRSPQAEHDWAMEAIPWMLNGTLSAADARRLRTHAESCEECRRELQIEEQLVRLMATRQTVDYAPHASLARMMKRIDRVALFSPRRWFSGLAGAAGEGRRGAAVFVIAAQAAALAVLAVALTWTLWSPEPKQRYVLAGAPAPSLPHLQVIFDEKASAAEILGILAKVNGRVIGGPSSAGVYLVAIEGSTDAMDSAARSLQDQPRVRFVAMVRAPPEH